LRDKKINYHLIHCPGEILCCNVPAESLPVPTTRTEQQDRLWFGLAGKAPAEETPWGDADSLNSIH